MRIIGKPCRVDVYDEFVLFLKNDFSNFGTYTEVSGVKVFLW